MKHKWAKEIKAWADGAEIQFLSEGEWSDTDNPEWNIYKQYRVKPQPVEPQYLYAYKKINNDVELDLLFIEPHDLDDAYKYVGKIPLIEDEK